MNEARRPTVLVAEDEPQIRRFVRAALEQEGYRVVESGTAGEAAEAAAREKPALVLVDLGLPDRDGVDLIRQLRLWSSVPIIVLSARSAENEKIEALDAGADDYLTKPFGTGEMLARVRVAMRRQAGESDRALAEIRFGDVQVDHVHRVVLRSGEPVHLTPIEYRLLALLTGKAGSVLTHRQMLKEVWGTAQEGDSTWLRVHVASLRRKLEAEPARPRHILTETGIGYRFVP